jgi:S-adenosylmethionine/arginine decarboxylase-like enzyme
MQASLIKGSEAQNIPTLETFNELGAWGLYSSVDVSNCDPDIIRDAEAIRQYVIQLCDLIQMKRFGETIVVNFGEDEKVAGYSMIQLIETSLISGHFANLTNKAYIDIFSCKHYDPDVAAHFTLSYFKGSDYKLNVTLRK